MGFAAFYGWLVTSSNYFALPQNSTDSDGNVTTTAADSQSTQSLMTHKIIVGVHNLHIFEPNITKASKGDSIEVSCPSG
jgi:hypothetical protein